MGWLGMEMDVATAGPGAGEGGPVGGAEETLIK